jgi:hypothetical protein
MAAGFDAAAGAAAPANGDGAKRQPGKARARAGVAFVCRRRPVKSKQADDQPQPEFSELWTAAHVRRECELPDGPPEFPTPRRAGSPECEVTADVAQTPCLAPDGAECQAEEADGQGRCFRDESTTG